MSEINHEKLNAKKKATTTIKMPDFKAYALKDGGIKIQVTGTLNTKDYLQKLTAFLEKNMIDDISWPTLFITPK